MTKNMGAIDRGIRVVVGVALLWVLFAASGGVRWVGLLGFVMLLTAAGAYCPLYSLLHIRTRSTPQTPQPH
jgi:Inner membrane protein YgaP-like, transmembrane domain